MVILKRIGYIDKVTHGNTGTHVTSYMFKNKKYYCSCISYCMRKDCKHLRELVNSMDETNLEDILKSTDGSTRFKSNLKMLNELVGDDLYNSDEIIAIYGKPASGKSLLALQEVAYLSTQGKNILYIDTEGSIIPTMRVWMPVFEKRFGNRKGKILVIKKKSLQSRYDAKGQSTDVGLMEYLGYHINIGYVSKHKTQKKTGKLEFSVVEHIDNPEIVDTIKKEKIDFIVLDSLTAPLKIFTKSQQNYPARDDASTFILKKLLEYQEYYKVGMLVINHASYNPMDMYETKATVHGGESIKYFGKRLLYIDKREKLDLSTYRRFWLVRGESSDGWSKACVGQIDDEGYHEVTDINTIKEIFTTTELGRLKTDFADETDDEDKSTTTH